MGQPKHLSLAEQLEAVKADASSIGRIHKPTSEVQLAALRANMSLYWQITSPCEEATFEYLKKRPFEIGRFAGVPDELKARVLVEVPERIHEWLRAGALRSPAEPNGFHDAVMREFLGNLKHRHAFRLVQKTVLSMLAIGYRWPEFDVILKSTNIELENIRDRS